MSQAKKGDTVRIHYTGRLQDGTVFDSSQGQDPLEFTIGAGEVIRGFENAALGLEVGQSKTATVPAADAYGPHRPEMVITVDRSEFEDDADPQVGQHFQARTDGGEMIDLTVVGISAEGVTLNGNHPLAGKDLIFDIELVEIV
jgi:peptidylprolyl isomerase